MLIIKVYKRSVYKEISCARFFDILHFVGNNKECLQIVDVDGCIEFSTLYMGLRYFVVEN